MNKSMLAVFSIMTIASYVSAKEVQINFDTRGADTPIVESIKSASAQTGLIIPEARISRQYYSEQSGLNCDARSCASGKCASTCDSEISVNAMLAKGTAKNEILKEMIRWYSFANPAADRNISALLEHPETQVIINDIHVGLKSGSNIVWVAEDKILVNTIKSVSPFEKSAQTKQMVPVCEMVEQVVVHYLWKLVDKALAPTETKPPFCTETKPPPAQG